jgi:Tfp pilus assembly protein PilF
VSFLNLIRSVSLTVLSVACYGQDVDNISVLEPASQSHIRGMPSSGTPSGPMDAAMQSRAGKLPLDNDDPFALDDTKKLGSSPITGTVSAQNLAKPPSKSALKYLIKAQHFSETGNTAKAIEVLRSAPLDPAGAPYLHSRLGTEYLKSGQYALAIPELEEAVRLLPKEAAHHSNLAFAYQVLGQLERAEKEARLAVDLDHSNSKAHFLLGSILLNRPSGVKEATANLKLARREIPSARFLLAQVYLLSGQREAAQREIEDFLSVATDLQRSIAQQWLVGHSIQPDRVSESAK